MIGIDIIETSRIRKTIERFGDHFLKRIFTDREILYCDYAPRMRYQRFAARFAAKEAFVKATGIRQLSLKDIEVVRDDYGKPEIELHGSASQYADDVGLGDVYVSISHCHEYAVANVQLIFEDDLDFDPNSDVELIFPDRAEDDDQEDDEDE